jgi:hypothetical protein
MRVQRCFWAAEGHLGRCLSKRHLDGDRASISNGMDPSLRHTFKEATTIYDYKWEREGIKMAVPTIGIDLAKHLWQLHGVDTHGRVVLWKKLSRTKL